jgi:selenium metabolism protein YedF
MANFAYFISSDKMGSQDPDLGKVLMRNFFLKIIDEEEYPTHILFVERGVLLLLPDFQGIEAMSILQSRGVKLLACQTCLDFYGIRDKLHVGELTNMSTIIHTLHEVDKVISL